MNEMFYADREALEHTSIYIFVERESLEKWVMKHFCWAWSSEAHEKIKLEVLGINPRAFEFDVDHKLWNIGSLAIVSLSLSYKYILEIVLSEEI